MGLNGTAGDWKIFSGEVAMGWVELSGIEFVAIREEDTTRLLYISYGGLHQTSIVEQTISKNGIERERKFVQPHVQSRELDGIREQWKKTGKVIRPKIKAILLADFLRGSREWKAIDLTDIDTITRSFGSGSIGRRGHIVLKSDEARLSEMDFTPEMAFKLLQSSMRASAEAKPDAVLAPEEPSVINTQEVATTPPPMQPKGEEPVSSKRSKVWLWLVSAIVLALAGGLLLKHRLRNR